MRSTSGAITPSLWGFEQREYLLEFYEQVGGSHYHVNYFRAGRRSPRPAGGARGPDRRLVPAVPEVPRRLGGAADENRIFKQRTVDIGVMSAEQAMAWGFSGPVACGACGRRLDLRKAQPYDMYGDWLDFDSAGRRHRRLLRSLPRPHAGDAAFAAHHPAILNGCRPGRSHPGQQDHAAHRGEMKRLDERSIHHFKLYTEGYHVPEGDLHRDRGARRASSAVTCSPTAQTALNRARSARRATHTSGDGGAIHGAPCWPTRSHHRQPRHRLRGDRPVSGDIRKDGTQSPGGGWGATHAVDQQAAHQPEHFAFDAESEAQIATIIARYPAGKQASAVIPLLYVVQKQMGRQTAAPGCRALRWM
jgi:hypothetical protein